MALFPENEKLVELRTRSKQFFQLFGESSPITKSLSKICANQGHKTRGGKMWFWFGFGSYKMDLVWIDEPKPFSNHILINVVMVLV